ncbi:MAG: adenosine deaminase [Actinobacteria bacterium HGW-Actinobacteria-7]|jgi:adenosine deaminase|nr:MAG: adenosine deaminase [Actinobacteria bacterium HGW-Actinobacteria-7]
MSTPLNSADLTNLARRMPKAELHLHLEGSLEPEMLFALAERNGIALRFGSVDEVRAAYEFDDLQSFLDIYYEGASALVTQRDFHDLTMAYLHRAAADNVVHVEPFFDPQTHTARGVAFDTVLGGIVSALREGEQTLGITWRLIMCFLRDLSAEEALATLEQALPYRDVITGVGLDSAEVGNPPEKFATVFEQALAHGFLTVSHAGEEGSADDVRRTLDVLHVSRIDHGVHALDDAQVVARLVRERIPLTVCPLSNVKLKVFSAMEEHNLREMLDAGLVATVNSDDPAYFGGYVGDNYAAVIKALDVTRDELEALALNSFEASFLSPAQKAARSDDVRTFFAR